MTKNDHQENSPPNGLAPEVHGNDCGKEEPEDEDQRVVVPFLEHHHRIGEQVAHVNGLALANHLGVLVQGDPA